MKFVPGVMQLLLERLLTALRFMTVVPIGWRAKEDSAHFNSCHVFFPVVGLLIGSIGWLLTQVCLAIFPQQVVAVIALMYLAFISGCLHLDGLSDSADGLLCARPRESALKIMKDSRVGAMGVVVVFFILLTKYATLCSVDKDLLALVIFFMPIVGRCSILIIMATQKYARAEGGLGRHFYSEKSKTAATMSCIGCSLLFVLLSPAHLPFIILFLAMALYLFHRWCQVRLGGATGDTLGAICEIGETITAISFSASLTFL
jgi:adenosylcobinamide-GDP ribazoletransferase